MHSHHFAVAAAALALAARVAFAQAYNIDFGDALSTPSPAYAAAGYPGVWNTLGVPAPGTFYPLVNLQGQPAGATLNNIGGTGLLAVSDPATSGDDGALIDDMLVGFNNPIDVCLWVNNIPNGEYEVLIYALTPGNSALISRTRVDDADQGPTFVGGAWPGQHQLGLTYSRHTVTVVANRIGLHSGLWNAQVQSGVNGIQVRRLIEGDLNGDGSVNVGDLLALVSAWGPCPAGQPCFADLDGSGTVNVADLLLLIGNWG